MPALEKAHETVELPGLPRLAGDIVQDVLLVARLTGPENPLREVTMIVAVPVEPTSTVIVDGDEIIAKS